MKNTALIGQDVEEAILANIHISVTNAHTAFEEYKKISPAKKALFLQTIAAEIISAAPILIPVTQQETALPLARLEGELQRTVKQLNLFADLLLEGSWVRAVIDVKENPAMDIRQMQVPLGVVAVFGASNFPFAFSVAGGDTVSALAAGCPVVYKAHPGHPETSNIVAGCIAKAAATAGINPAVFTMVSSTGIEAGQALVKHSLVSAVAFTGSLKGGKALFDTAAKRPQPIPVYAEMGSVNPVFILPRILHENGDDIAAKIIGSNHQGVGQFCTNPGIVVMPPLHGVKNFIAKSAELVGVAKSGVMLTAGIHAAYQQGVEKFAQKNQVKLAAAGQPGIETKTATPHLFVTDADNFLNDQELHEELFGPSSLFVETSHKADLYTIARQLQGQLTATVWGTDDDLREFADLIPILEEKAGRLLINGVPTGVEVTAAMIHGGPYPATTDARTTSVGTDAIYRFTRPVCYQNFPPFLLPDALKDENPLNITRIKNGKFV